MEEEKGQTENIKETTKKKQMDDNVVYIGTKPFMNYINAVVMTATIKKHKEIKIVARGKSISRAVDVAETSRINFLSGENEVIVDSVKISSGELKRKEDNKLIRVSEIEIVLIKKK